MEWIGVRNALTTDDVNAVQKEMGVRLPDDYIKKIGAINAGGLVDSIVNHPQLGEIAYSRNIPLRQRKRLISFCNCRKWRFLLFRFEKWRSCVMDTRN